MREVGRTCEMTVARAGAGYARADFTAGYDGKTVTCPQGKTSAFWTPCVQRGNDAIVATFSATDCAPCLARPLCTTSSKNRRQLTVLPRNLAEAQAAARAAETTTGFQADYARRAGVEGTIHQAVATARAAPATAACRKPASTTRTWPARST